MHSPEQRTAPSEEDSAALLLLTGVPGVGKTTAALAARDLLPDTRLAGFTTQELRRGGRRVGFRGITLAGADEIIAHVDLPGPHRVGRYGVDVSAIDRLADSLRLRDDVDVTLLDEIGKMECLSAAFVRRVRDLLSAPTCLVATVSLHGSGLIEEVKRRPGSVLWEVTRGNRAELPYRVAGWILEHTTPTGRTGGSA